MSRGPVSEPLGQKGGSGQAAASSGLQRPPAAPTHPGLPDAARAAERPRGSLRRAPSAGVSADLEVAQLLSVLPRQRREGPMATVRHQGGRRRRPGPGQAARHDPGPRRCRPGAGCRAPPPPAACLRPRPGSPRATGGSREPLAVCAAASSSGGAESQGAHPGLLGRRGGRAQDGVQGAGQTPGAMPTPWARRGHGINCRPRGLSARPLLLSPAPPGGPRATKPASTRLPAAAAARALPSAQARPSAWDARSPAVSPVPNCPALAATSFSGFLWQF